MTTEVEPRKNALVPVAVAAAGVGLLLILIGTYLDTPFRSTGSRTWGITSEELGAVELVVLVLFAVAGAASVFGLVVRGALRHEPARTAVVALVTAVVGVLSIVVFWTGLPVILAIASAVLARDARVRLGFFPITAKVALVLAALTVVAATVIAFTG